jgi:NADH:ubiquinone oxidoreductase subunit E
MSQEIKELLHKYAPERENLILVLQELQAKFGYISREMMQEVASFFSIPASCVYSLVSFYKKFRRNPPGIYPITVCMGTACYLQGAELVLSAIERELGIKPTETTQDGLFSVDTAACFGCCGLAPVIKVKEDIYPKVTPSKVEELIMNLKEKIKQTNRR